MTPLALKIVSDLTLPMSRKKFVDRCDLTRKLRNAHCFDITNVLEIVIELANQQSRAIQHRGAIHLTEQQCFLPAPSTWIEGRNKDNGRFGVLLEDKGLFAEARWAEGNYDEQGYYLSSQKELGILSLNSEWMNANDRVTAVRHYAGKNPEDCLGWNWIVWSALAVINTPRLIGRRQHMPHRGLERKLLRAGQTSGAFPLRAWTELTLSVSAAMTQADGNVHEAHLTGEKCLHFCRSHLRVRNGRLEQVKAHWRGNAALGIKRTRYNVVP